MPARLKLVLAYDGAAFAGWQSQKNGRAVQDVLEGALAKIVGQKVRVNGAGRTDAGVHALGQVAHVDLPRRSLAPERWPAALNGALPPTLRVLRAAYVSAKFHARYSARAKTYRYRIWNAAILPPLEVGRAWHVPRPLDFETMRREARAFIGRHDFASFAANRGGPKPETWRTIHLVRMSRRGARIAIEVTGDGFLYRMVRLMAGALVRAGTAQSAAGEIARRLRAPEGTLPGARYVAPAEGLRLVRVRY